MGESIEIDMTKDQKYKNKALLWVLKVFIVGLELGMILNIRCKIFGKYQFLSVSK